MTMPSRIAVTSRSFSRHPVLREELSAKYAAVTFNDTGVSLAGDALIDFLQGHDGAIVALETMDRETLSRLPELRVLSKYGVGYDKVDLSALQDMGIRFGWKGGVNKRSVSELVIALSVSMLRRLPETQADLSNGTWRQVMGRQLSDCTFGIVGCGHIGKDLAKLLKAFGTTVMAHDILDFSDFYSEWGVRPVDLPTLLASADIVSLHLPLDHSTRNIIGQPQLEIMKPGSFLINAARGGLVDEAALKQSLMSGQLAGAAFDVFAIEPPEDEELMQLDNLIVTPHIGGSSEEAILAMGRAAIDGLASAKVPVGGVPDE